MRFSESQIKNLRPGYQYRAVVKNCSPGSYTYGDRSFSGSPTLGIYHTGRKQGKYKVIQPDTIERKVGDNWIPEKAKPEFLYLWAITRQELTLSQRRKEKKGDSEWMAVARVFFQEKRLVKIEYFKENKHGAKVEKTLFFDENRNVTKEESSRFFPQAQE